MKQKNPNKTGLMDRNGNKFVVDKRDSNLGDFVEEKEEE